MRKSYKITSNANVVEMVLMVLNLTPGKFNILKIFYFQIDDLKISQFYGFSKLMPVISLKTDICSNIPLRAFCELGSTVNNFKEDCFDRN